MVKEYKESDLDHKEEMPLIARQAIAMGIILLIVFVVARL